MSTSFMFLVLSPFFVLAASFVVVVVVALCRAKPEDIPVVLERSSTMFRRLVSRSPSQSLDREPAGREDEPMALRKETNEAANVEPK